MSNEPLALDEYLKRHSIEKGDEYSHTRIGDKSSKIYAGSYLIKNSDDFKFSSNSWNSIFVALTDNLNVGFGCTFFHNIFVMNSL